MRTRRGVYYPEVNKVKRRSDFQAGNDRKRSKRPPDLPGTFEFFEQLHDDLVICILSRLSATAGSPADNINVLLTCKRFHALAQHPEVLKNASAKMLAVKAKNWCDSAHEFMKRCIRAGSLEACYTLGMIRFYCLRKRKSGLALLIKASMANHVDSLYSLAVIQFNGSGGPKSSKDLKAGVVLCARASALGHVDAMRELGHCLQDGYGVRRDVAHGRRFLVHANARELAAVFSVSPSYLSHRTWLTWNPFPEEHTPPGSCSRCPLLSDYGCDVPRQEPHPATRFLTEWFAAQGGSPAEGLRMCSNVACGRPETRSNEFRRCSVCGGANYCSRACQAIDWKSRHKAVCAPAGDGYGGGNGNGNGDVNGGGNGDANDLPAQDVAMMDVDGNGD
ncbi:hypothetical protein NMG60_11030912 [Bertholletia excelsa]